MTRRHGLMWSAALLLVGCGQVATTLPLTQPDVAQAMEDAAQPGDVTATSTDTELGADTTVGPCVTAQDCDDHDVCTVDTCDVGKGCKHMAIAAETCADGNACTLDHCEPQMGCVHMPNDGACDDGNACTSGDNCATGACKGTTAVNCDDQNVCTDDACDPKAGCTHAASTKPCDDGNACTSVDTCVDGTCKGSGGPDCNDNNPCTDDTCALSSGCAHANNIATCNDGNACTTGDACKGGGCTGGAALNCDDQNPCTQDACDKVTGCTHAALSKTKCDDGNACTTSDTCVNGSCAGTAKSCTDGNLCTLDVCDPTTGACGNPKVVCPGVPCNPGTCDLSTGACKNVPVNCDDKNPCTSDLCDVTTGKCSHGPFTGVCNDGNLCTILDSCATGSCKGTTACDDGNPCTTDTCTPLKASAACSHTNLADKVACDDGDKCTLKDLCIGGVCGGIGSSCNDMNACTIDFCNGTTGACTYYPVKGCTPCGAGGACPSGQVCNNGACLTKLPWKAPCKTSDQCGLGPNGAQMVCTSDIVGSATTCHQSNLPYSGYCSSDVECASNSCGPLGCRCTKDDQCPTNIPHFCTKGGYCVPKLPTGAPCEGDNQCSTPTKCLDTGVGNAKLCLPYNLPYGSGCLYNSACASNVCVATTCGCASDADCGSKSQCKAGICTSCCVQTTICKPCPNNCSCGSYTAEACLPGCPN